MTVDARGTRCPRPVLALAEAVGAHPGTLVTLLADDPDARVDVPVWCRLRGHALVALDDRDGALRFTVRPGG